MTRPKGLPKTGGRKAGIPNKVTADLKSWIQELIDGNRRKFEQDLKKLLPRDRLVILERLMQYVVPKQQSVDIRTQIEAEFEALERLMETAPEEVFERLEKKIENLNNSKNESDR